MLLEDFAPFLTLRPSTRALMLQSKEEGKNQESIQSSTTTDPGYRM